MIEDLKTKIAEYKKKHLDTKTALKIVQFLAEKDSAQAKHMRQIERNTKRVKRALNFLTSMGYVGEKEDHNENELFFLKRPQDTKTE